MLILGIDQGTSGSKAIVIDERSIVRGAGYRPVARLHPQPGWTEQDPVAIAQGVREAIADALAAARCRPVDIAACGIASQRNTDFVWDAARGLPLGNAISWQDLRTHDLLAELRAEESIWPETLHRLGQRPGPYSAAVHLGWRMRHDQVMSRAARAGTLRTGLSAEWLLVALGSAREHAMDYSLVQAQSLFDMRADDYWQAYLDWLRVPREALAVPRPTLHDYGTLLVEGPSGPSAEIPVLAMIADQPAALFGYDCRRPGDGECTHGTATYVDVCVGSTAPAAQRMQSYYAWVLPAETGAGQAEPNAGAAEPAAGEPNAGAAEAGPGEFEVEALAGAADAGPAAGAVGPRSSAAPATAAAPADGLRRTYCLEGDATVTGAVIRWLRETARLLDDERDVGPLAGTVADAAGVTFVPAFTGLNVPYQDSEARGSILGLTLGTTRAHVARAFLDSLGFQVRAILEEVAAETGVRVQRLKVGGGVSASDVACQVQADWLGIPVERPEFTDTTPRAAALLAGLGAGAWPSVEGLPTLPGGTRVFEPRLGADERDAGFERWRRTVDLVRGYPR